MPKPKGLFQVVYFSLQFHQVKGPEPAVSRALQHPSVCFLGWAAIAQFVIHTLCSDE